MKKLVRKKITNKKKEVKKRCICGEELTLPMFILRLESDELMEVCSKCFKYQEDSDSMLQGEMLNQLVRKIITSYQEQGGMYYE